jgi:hypothetical protein
MSLLNDYAALAFANDVIRDILPGNPDRHAGCTMEVAEGERVVCSIVFPVVRWPPAPACGHGAIFPDKIASQFGIAPDTSPGPAIAAVLNAVAARAARIIRFIVSLSLAFFRLI